jgi:uncharacterized protein YkwD
MNRSRWMNTVGICLGIAALATVGTTAQAQTYYYYPTTVPAAPSVPSGANVQPMYVRGTVGNQVTWYTYPTQYYQPAYTVQSQQAVTVPQYYQTTYVAQSAPAPSDPQVTQTNFTQPSAAPVAPAAPEASDPYGFLGWLNATRASYGLPAVGYDPNLTNWAAMNNDQQAARGMGHFVMGPARRQNSAMGAFANIGSMWMNSPAHRAALLDPTIRAIGIAGLGAYWTFNAY